MGTTLDNLYFYAYTSYLTLEHGLMFPSKEEELKKIFNDILAIES